MVPPSSTRAWAGVESWIGSPLSSWIQEKEKTIFVLTLLDPHSSGGAHYPGLALHRCADLRLTLDQCLWMFLSHLPLFSLLPIPNHCGITNDNHPSYFTWAKNTIFLSYPEIPRGFGISLANCLIPWQSTWGLSLIVSPGQTDYQRFYPI